jgi:hypothetical protein
MTIETLNNRINQTVAELQSLGWAGGLAKKELGKRNTSVSLFPHNGVIHFVIKDTELDISLKPLTDNPNSSAQDFAKRIDLWASPEPDGFSDFFR